MRVNGACPYIPEVLTPGTFFIGYGIWNLVGSIFHLFRIFVWQIVLCEDGVHLCLVLTFLAKNVNNFCNDVALFVVRPRNDFRHSHIICLAPFELFLGDDDVCGDIIVLWNQESKSFFHFQFTYKLVFLALDNFRNLCFAYVVAFTRHHHYAHLVTLHSKERVTLCYEDRFF